jgi:hypothetical protein
MPNLMAVTAALLIPGTSRQGTVHTNPMQRVSHQSYRYEPIATAVSVMPRAQLAIVGFPRGCIVLLIRTLRLGFEKNPTGSCCLLQAQGLETMVIMMLVQPTHLQVRHQRSICGVG